MMARQPGPEQILRAWADALNAVADLQHAIAEEAEQMTMLDDWEWLDPFRAIVFGTLKTFPDTAKKVDSIEWVQGLQRTAIGQLELLREEAAQRRRSQ